MIGRKMLYLSLVFIICTPGFVFSSGNPPGQPFQYLQQQIDRLEDQLIDFLDSSIPPRISYQEACDGSSLNIDLIITGNKEIAYYAIQEQGGNPPTNIITFVEPGLTNVNYRFTLDSGTLRKLLFIASDTGGSTSKLLHVFDLNNCSPQDPCANSSCGPNSTCTANGQTYQCICDNGYAACDGNPSNGCETNLLTSTLHCGDCLTSCGPGKSCIAGACN